MLKRRIIALCLIGTLAFTGCGNQGESGQTDSNLQNGLGNEADSDGGEDIEKESTPIVVEDVFSNRDFKTEYEKNVAYIELNGNSATCSSNAVEIKSSTITIKDEGTYVITGSLNNGMLIVDADEQDKTQIVLKNASIHNENGAAIYVRAADKAFITLESGTENIVSSGATFEAIEEEEIDGVVYSMSDLTFNGAGSLGVKSPAGHGIVSKDDLVLTGGTYHVDAKSHGLSANDMLGIAGGTFTIVSGEDSIHCDMNVYVENGTFEINATDDAFHADENLLIAGGKINITNSYEGLEALDIVVSGGDIKIVADDDGLNAAGGTDSSGFGGQGERPSGNRRGGPGGGMPGGFGGFGGSSDGSILISGGTLYVKAYGDGIDANGTLEITGGSVTVCGPTQGDTATLDYDVSGVITGGTFFGTGGTMMAQSFSDSQQGVIGVQVGNQQAGILITLTDSSGNVVISHEPELPFAIVILSSPEIQKGETYTITVGELSGDFEAE